MKSFLPALVMTLILLSLLPSAHAATADYSAVINFPAGVTSNASYDYITIVPENSSNPANITVKAWKSNMTVYIDENNIQKVTLDVKKAMREFGLTSQDVDFALRTAGKIRFVLAGNGTNTYVVENLPAVAKVRLDGAVSGNYSVSGSTLTLTTHMSTHTLTIEFEPLYAPVFDVVPVVVALLMVSIVVKLMGGMMKSVMKNMKFGR